MHCILSPAALLCTAPSRTIMGIDDAECGADCSVSSYAGLDSQASATKQGAAACKPQSAQTDLCSTWVMFILGRYCSMAIAHCVIAFQCSCQCGKGTLLECHLNADSRSCRPQRLSRQKPLRRLRRQKISPIPTMRPRAARMAMRPQRHLLQ